MGIRALLSQIYASKFLRHALLAFLIVALFLGGIQLRRWIGESTRHVRYQHDIVNAFYWGSETMKEARRLAPDEASANSLTGFGRGYLALYDRVKHKAYNKDYGLDYPPLRLLVMAIWARASAQPIPRRRRRASQAGEPIVEDQSLMRTAFRSGDLPSGSLVSAAAVTRNAVHLAS